MTAILNGLILALLVRCGWTLYQAWRSLRHTTLATTIGWSAVALAAFTLAWTASAFWGGLSDGWQDQLWYWAAVIAVIPPIAVLGARRPGSGAWNAFVLVPLLFILGWPAFTVWSFSGPGRLQVESPALIGFVLALVMGCGNYLSTRLLIPALIYPLAVIQGLALFAASAPPWVMLHADGIRLGSALGLIAVCLMGEVVSRSARPLPPGPDRVWADFCETFGIVWAMRCLDRINQEFAEREQWPVRLGPLGWEWTTSEISTEERARILARMEHALRWMLRRFVDEPWIDERMPPGP